MHGYNNKNIVMHELVSLEVEVVDSCDRDQIGIRGIVVRETKNTLGIKSESDIKLVPKMISTFIFKKDGRSYKVKGNEICFGSVERTEKAAKFYRKRKAMVD